MPLPTASRRAAQQASGRAGSDALRDGRALFVGLGGLEAVEAEMRIYVIIVAVILLGSGAWYVIGLKDKADRVDAAEKSLADYKGAVAAREAQEAKDRQADADRRQALAGQLAAKSAELDELRKHPPAQVIHYVTREGKPTVANVDCPAPRLDPEFVRDWNDISQASAVPHP